MITLIKEKMNTNNKLLLLPIIVLAMISSISFVNEVLPVKSTAIQGRSNLLAHFSKKQSPAKFINCLKNGKKITIVTMRTSLTGDAYRWQDCLMKEWLDKDFLGQVTFIMKG